MRKIKSPAGLSLSKVGYIKLGDIELPIRTAGIKKANLSTSKIAEIYKIPVARPRLATPEEVEDLKKNNITLDTKATPFIRDFDKTSKEYIAMEEDKRMNEVFLNIAIHVELSYNVENNEGKTVPMWKELGLANADDIIGLAKWIGNIETDMLDYQMAILQINNIKQYGYKNFEDVPEKPIYENPEIETVKDEREAISE